MFIVRPICFIKHLYILKTELCFKQYTVKHAYVVTSIKGITCLKQPPFLDPLMQNTVQMNLYEGVSCLKQPGFVLLLSDSLPQVRLYVKHIHLPYEIGMINSLAKIKRVYPCYDRIQ